MTYLKRFKTRLKGTNAIYLKQLAGLLSALAAFCTDWLGKKLPDQMLTAGEVVKRCGADQMNLRDLDRYVLADPDMPRLLADSLCYCSYLSTSKIAQKISGYMENLEEKAELSGKYLLSVFGEVPY